MSEDMRDRVKEKYAKLATAAGSGDGGSCCGSSCGCGSGGEVAVQVSDLSRGSYSESERGELPLLAAEASLGCGNPVALADLSPGGVVLDLGSGGGLRGRLRRGNERLRARDGRRPGHGGEARRAPGGTGRHRLGPRPRDAGGG